MNAEGGKNWAGYLEGQLPLVNSIVSAIARRKRLSETEAEEFRSAAYLKLLVDDYAVLRAFTGRCTLRTYLTVVLQRVFLDCRTREWGKWRPSAQSRRAGQAGVRLERLVVRDEVPIEQAINVVAAAFSVSRNELLELARSFKMRVSRRPVTAPLEEPADTGIAADQRVHRGELQHVADEVSKALEQCVRALPPDDRDLLQSRFWSGRTVADIARTTRVPQKKLYVRFDNVIRRLRASLTEQGYADMSRALLAEDSWGTR